MLFSSSMARTIHPDVPAAQVGYHEQYYIQYPLGIVPGRWHLIGGKSNVGTLVDSGPNLVDVAFILLSRRIRSTFIIRPS